MPNIIEILARAQSLMNETALNSITPPRAGGIMYDTLLVLNQMQLEGSALLISKVYASVSAMEADTTPTSDLTGRALKPGQLVVIVTSDSSSSDMGSEYRFNGPGSWTYVGKVGGLPLDTVPTQGSTKGITSGAVFQTMQALEGQVGQLSTEMVPISAGCLKKETVDVSSLGVRNYYIDSSTGKYTTNTTYKHSLVPVSPGQSVRVTSNRDNSTSVSFFKTDAAPVSGGTPDYSDAYTEIYRVTVPSGTYKDFIVPADAHFMYVYRGSSSATPAYPYTPDSIVIMKPAFNPDQALNGAKTTDYANVGTVVDAAFNGTDFNKESIDLSAVTSQTMTISASNTFNSSGNHGLIPVVGGDVLEVVGGGGLAAFVGGVYCPHSGSSVSDLALTTTMVLESGKTYYLRAPSNANGFIYNTVESGNNVAPTAINKYTPVSSSKELTNIPTGRWVISSGALDYGSNSQNKNYLFRLYANRRYVFKISDTNASVVGVLLSDLPYIGQSVTTVYNLNSPYQQGRNLTLAYVPTDDCYMLFRLFKSSSPTLTIVAYDETDITSPIENANDIDNTMFFWRLNYNAYTLRSRVILTDGVFGTATNYKHILLPVKAGQYIKVKKGVYNARLAWLTAIDTLGDYAEPSYLAGTGTFSVSDGIIRVPDGANYLYIQLGQSPYDYWPDFIAVSVDYDAMPDIVIDNDYERTRRLLFQLTSTTRAENDVPYKPLTLVHYSDIHGRKTCQNRINEFREFWKDYIDDTIQTGDLVTSYWGDGSAFDEEIAPADNPSRDILSVIGNHDVASKSGSDFVWHTYQGKQAYDRYIAPFISYWGDVVQPTGASENGYCFYYKDYPDSKIRLVVLDTFNNDDAYEAFQQTWFAGVLADAISEGLSVIVASHFRIKCETLLKSPFTMPWAAVENPDSSVCNDPYIPLVKEFIDNGGELVCWITGHSHYDAISKTSEENGSQINICVNRAGAFGSKSTSLWETNSFINIDFSDWKTFDCFNVMAIDTHYKFITLFRVGSNRDKMGRLIETCCIRYKTGEILYP